MMTSSRKTFTTILAAATLATGLNLAAQEPAQSAPAQPVPPQADAGLPMRLTGFAINQTGASPKSTGTFDIQVDRFSTQEERLALIAAYEKGGQDELLKALQAIPKRVGFIKFAQSIGYDLQYAWLTPLPEGGKFLFLATDRPVSAFEQMKAGRRMDYPFTIIQIKLPDGKKGEGKVSAQVQIRTAKDGKNIELENYGTLPTLLNSITEVSPSKKK